MTNLDLLVIGGGLSGMAAALAAAEAGLRVRMIAKGMGSLHWSAASFDLLGYRPGEEAPVHWPLNDINRLVDDHPLQRAGADACEQLAARFQRVTETFGLPYLGRKGGENMLLPSAVGALRPALLAPAAQAAGDLREPGPLLIVGFRGLRDFYPQLIVENLQQQGFTARCEWLPLSLISDRADRNAPQLATVLDQEAVWRQLGQAVRGLVRPGERVGLPALLGNEQHLSVWQGISQLAGAPVFEIPLLPPSVPGIRLTTALRRRLAALGVRMEVGMEAIGFGTEEDRIVWVESATSARPLKHRANAYLLATGGVLGGGFSSDPTGHFWETVFDLPLTVAQDRAHWFRPAFFDPRGQPLFAGGVAVDAQWQPVNAAGVRVFANLWAAGGLLHGADTIAERSLEGVGWVTGTLAGQALARQFALQGEKEQHGAHLVA